MGKIILFGFIILFIILITILGKRVLKNESAKEQKLDAYVKVQLAWAKAFGEYSGNITPLMMGGGSGSVNGWNTQMDFMNLKALKDLQLNISNK